MTLRCRPVRPAGVKVPTFGDGEYYDELRVSSRSLID
jgi:hypothetical protein